MPRRDVSEADCAIAQALAVVGDWWSLLIVRDVAGGLHRFDALQTGLSVSRKVLTERLRDLVADGVLQRVRYREAPERFEYHLTPAGRDLLPVLVAFQTWGSQHLLGTGQVTAGADPAGPEAHRMRSLTGHTVPPMTLPGAGGPGIDLVAGSRWTVLYTFPGAYAPADHGYPPGWDTIPGARGCTLEARTFRARHDLFASRGVTVHGVSTQRPDQLASFARHEDIPYPLLSDSGLQFTAALRLATFRAGGHQRLKRATLIVDRERAVRAVRYPVPDPAGAVDDALAAITALEEGRSVALRR